MIERARKVTVVSAPRLRLLVSAVLCASSAACSGESSAVSVAGDSVAERGSMIVYDSDDRREYFELDEPAIQQLMRAQSVALMNDDSAASLLANPASVPTWAETEGLCPEEPFASQPAAAFCSGVLLADDLLVTAEHCLDFVSVPNLRLVFGYYYLETGELAARPADVYRVESIVLRASDLGLHELDFAWLRLSASANPALEALRSFDRNPRLAIGDNLLAISAGGGVPLKVDPRVRVAGFEEGRFIAESDTFRGSSGGGAFAPNGDLVGLFVRGLADFETSEAGCMTTRHHASAGAREQFTYAYRAVEAFCNVEPQHSLCQKALREPSCALSVSRGGMPTRPIAALLALLGALFARRLRHRPVRQ
jgi:hypothetical protein